MKAIRGRKRAATLNGAAKLAVVKGPSTEVSEPDIEMIRKRAYELFLARGAIHGADLADWFEAERELRAPSQL